MHNLMQHVLLESVCLSLCLQLDMFVRYILTPVVLVQISNFAARVRISMFE